MDTPTLLTYQETSDSLGVSVRKIQRWVTSGLLPVVRFTRRTIKIPKDKLYSLIESGGIPFPKKKVDNNGN